LEIVYVLLPISILLAAGALAAYFWAVKNGQYDDLDTPSLRVLFEEEKKGEPPPGEGNSQDTAKPPRE
jgi:cbb3-type cytochrome oxidase maturation protein